MSTVTLQLPADTERKLRDKAGQLGQTLEAYLQHLAEKAGNGTLPSPAQGEDRSMPVSCESEDFPKFISRPRPTLEEMERLLDELSAGPPGKVLPADFSRADIYDDHD